jgi:hypothetical protein
MSTAVTQATCFHHPLREAAAKCVSCGNSFCRECVTPVDRRMMCADCFKLSTAVKERPKRDWFVLSFAAQALLGLLGLWFTTYFLGRVLLELPTSFHEGTVWEKVIR